MKIIISTFVIFFCNILFPQNNSGLVNYSVIMPDFNYTAKGDYSLLKGVYLASKQIRYELKFDQNGSEFARNKALLIGVNADEEEFMNFAESKLTSRYKYYYNKTISKKFQSKKSTLFESFVINWQITNESKKIDIYNCFKAIGEYQSPDRNNELRTWKVEAWFAPSLPFPYGPKFYNGLPGLILELTEKSSNIVYGVASIELYRDDKIKVNFPKGEIISYEEYSQRVANGMNPIAKKTLENRK